MARFGRLSQKKIKDFTMNNRRAITIIALVILCVSVRIIFKWGIFLVSDDVRYSKSAYEISQFDFNLPQNHHTLRVGHTASIALFYLLFGVNEISAIGASILFSVLNVVLIFLLCRMMFIHEPWVKIGSISALFFIFVPLSIEKGASVDFAQGLTFFMNLSVYFFFLGDRQKNKLYYLAAGLSIGISYLYHQTGAYVFLVIAIYVIINKRVRANIIFVFVGFVAILMIENGIYYSKTQKILYRQAIAAQTHFQVDNTETINGLSKIGRKQFKTINNPYTGTFIGDSWLIEPFRQILLNPTYSILYHIFFSMVLYLYLTKDNKFQTLLLMFSILFLYYSYGSPNPLSYHPLRRLPRYIIPCLIPVCIITGYGINRIEGKKLFKTSLISLFIFISLFCISIKGGEMGQRYHQSKFFYQFMNDHPEKKYLADNITFSGLEFLNKYKLLHNIERIKFDEYIKAVREKSINFDEIDYIFVNVHEIYELDHVNLPEAEFILIAQNQRKPRRICYLPMVKQRFKESLCNVSNGGKIYSLKPKSSGIE